MASATNKTDVQAGNDGDDAPHQQKSALDISKVNDLMENVDNRLAGGLHGKFYEEGSKLDEKHRHGQLQAMFNLRKELLTPRSRWRSRTNKPKPNRTKLEKEGLKLIRTW